MAKSQKQSPFWKPKKPGETITGKFSHFSVSLFKARRKNEQDRKVVVLHFQDVKAKIVPFSFVLLDLFAPVRTKIKPGDPVKIEFIERKAIKGRGQGLLLYSATWKGKELEQSKNGELGKPATKKELDEVFNAGG